jgi:hypothetical protein
MNATHLFSINRTGDPFNKTGWDVHEYQHSFDETICTFRGDLSPSQGRDRTIQMLRSLYPGCKIRVE